MVEKCPKCKETLITRTIEKELDQGSIFIPIAQVCPKCNWNKDLTGAGDIVAKPAVPEGNKTKFNETPVVKPIVPEPMKTQVKTSPKPMDMNKIITVALALIVIAGIAWAFIPKAEEQKNITPAPVQTPAVTPAPTITAIQVPEVTPTGNKIYIKLDRYRIFRGANPNIRPGDEIIWVNDGIDPVILASSNIPDFKDRPLDNGKQTSYIFKKPGTYNFYLKNNNNVNSTIVVVP